MCITTLLLYYYDTSVYIRIVKIVNFVNYHDNPRYTVASVISLISRYNCTFLSNGDTVTHVQAACAVPFEWPTII